LFYSQTFVSEIVLTSKKKKKKEKKRREGKTFRLLHVYFSILGVGGVKQIPFSSQFVFKSSTQYITHFPLKKIKM